MVIFGGGVIKHNQNSPSKRILILTSAFVRRQNLESDSVFVLIFARVAKSET